MALLAEEIVEEWLNRQGYFTIRGIKLGVHEIDLLAVRFTSGGCECRHIEVQASIRPVSYLTKLPKDVVKSTGRAAGSAKVRLDTELEAGIREWIHKKYDHPVKKKARLRLAPGPWSRELVVHEVKFPGELEIIAKLGVTVRKLADVLEELKCTQTILPGAAGAHLVDLIALTAASIKGET
jgi:hypothetical protein